ncbi:MAG: hypothetical protein JWO06_1108 [Bacteroidota bacterium]|nr:hypothetical protein [Bacteroidota bacterium]
MKLSVLSCFLILAFSFSSCKYPTQYRVINAGNRFSLSVPSWLKEEPGLKPGADFQYANRYRNFYAIANADKKDSVKAGLGDVMTGNIKVLRQAMINPIVSDSTDVEIGGIKGARAEVFGKMGTEDIYFSEVVLEGKNNYYHLSVWTRGADRKLKFKEDINRILNSFKEL